jgi:pimeloyl-ACP methyl ester carboxylesterase
MNRYSAIVSGVHVAFWQYNTAASKTILMLHGFRGNHLGLSDVAEYLDEYRVILPDLPGSGDSHPLNGPPSVQAYVTWVDELAQALDLTDFVIWGHSYGATVALAHSALGLQRSDLVIAVSPAPLGSTILDLIPTSFYFIGRCLPRELRKHWVLNHHLERLVARLLLRTTRGDRRKVLIERGQETLSTINPDTAIEQFLAFRRLRLAEYARAARCPVLVVAGGRDVIVRPGKLLKLARAAPHGHIVIMPKQGHLSPIEEPEGLANITKSFLAQWWPSSKSL